MNILLDRSDIVKTLMTTDDPGVLEGYVIELLSVDPPVQGIHRKTMASEPVSSTSIKAGDLIYRNLANANLNVSFEVSRHSSWVSQSI